MLQNCERFRRVRMRANSGHGVDEDINLDIYKSNLLNRVVWRTENRKKGCVFSLSLLRDTRMHFFQGFACLGLLFKEKRVFSYFYK